MTKSTFVNQSDIDVELARVLSDADECGLHVAREVINEPGDRWYGQLVVNTYALLTDTPDGRVVVPAAATIELLRGYIRIRSQLLAQLIDERPHSLTEDP